MTLTTFALDGTAIEDLGLSLASLTGLHDAPTRSPALVQPALTYGQRALSIGTTIDLRTIGFRLNLPATSFTNRQALVDAFVARFNAQVELVSADAPTRAAYGVLKSQVGSTPGKLFVNPVYQADIAFICPDPLWYDLNPVVTNVPAATTVALPIGTGPVRRLAITVLGTTTNPIVIILRDQTGTEVQRMTLTAPTGNLGASNWATIDCDRFTLLKSDGTDLFTAKWLGATESWFHLLPPLTYAIECAQTALRVTHFRSYVA